MKKKHLQFNDITAPSLARRAARQGAEKGESGRMEPGVINVFFFSFSLQEAALNSSYSFQNPSLLHPFLLFCSLAHSFLAFVEMKLSIILFRKLAILLSLTSDSLWFSVLKHSYPGHGAHSIALFLSHPSPIVWLHQGAIDACHNKEGQASMLS